MDREPARSFHDLVVWQRSHSLVLRVYQLTANFPKHELFGLTSQMRRSAVSVPANIAEAFSKRSKADKARMLNISQGSLEELRYYFILAGDLKYLTKEQQRTELDDVARMLGAYTRSLHSSS